MMRFLLTATVLVVGGFSYEASAAELKGIFVVDGEAPAPRPVIAPQAAADFPKLKFVYEDVVVDPKSKGLANVLIYVRGDTAVTEEAKRNIVPQVVIEMKDGRFRQHVNCLWVGRQRFFTSNADEVAHYANFSAGGFGVSIPVGPILEHPVVPASAVPKQLTCDVHPWMQTYVLFSNHPYATASNADGSFEIKNLPVDTELEIQLWHEVRGYMLVNDDWPKGRRRFTLTAEGLDLGEIKVPAGLLRR